MTNTSANLKEAFAGESQANRRYVSYAQQADKEGFAQAARLFRAVAHAEAVHAKNHLKALDGVGATAENLKEAMSGENYEVHSMYPPFIETAEAEANKRAATSFRWAWEVEKEHEVLFKQVLDSLGGPSEELEIWVCPVCGHTHVGPREAKCPVCGTPGERFEKFD